MSIVMVMGVLLRSSDPEKTREWAVKARRDLEEILVSMSNKLALLRVDRMGPQGIFSTCHTMERSEISPYRS